MYKNLKIIIYYFIGGASTRKIYIYIYQHFQTRIRLNFNFEKTLHLYSIKTDFSIKV